MKNGGGTCPKPVVVVFVRFAPIVACIHSAAGVRMRRKNFMTSAELYPFL